MVLALFILFVYLFFRENWNIGEMHIYYFLSVFLYKFPEATRNDRPQDPGSQGTKKMFQDVSIWWQYFAGCYETHLMKHQYGAFSPTSPASMLYNLEQKRAFTWEKSSTPTGFVWNINMAAVTSYEKRSIKEALHAITLVYFTTVANLLSKALPWRRRRLLFNNWTHS